MRKFKTLIVGLIAISSVLTVITIQQFISKEKFEYGLEPPISIEKPHALDFIVIANKSYGFVYSNSLFLSIISWTALIGALVWQGSIRKIWFANGFDRQHFELMVKMRGSRKRLEVLQTLIVPKTRQLIAQELNCDWKAVDWHMKVLKEHNLVKEICNVGQSTFYVRTESGNKLLGLLKNGFSDESGKHEISNWKVKKYYVQ